MIYSFHPDAEAELNVSVDYYEECKDGLGAEFAYEVYKTIQRILEYPTAWQTDFHLELFIIKEMMKLLF